MTTLQEKTLPRLPEAVIRRAVSQGDQGRYWLSVVPSLLEELCEIWSLQFKEILNGGSESLTAVVTCSDRSEAVLKIGLPGATDLSREARAYRLANGDGYATCYQHDDARNAILIEKLGHPIATSGLSVNDQITAICESLLRSWKTVDDTFGLLFGDQKALWLADFATSRWQRLAQPCNKSVIDLAVTFAEKRAQAHDIESSVLVHGDAHELNTLRSTSNGPAVYKLIDPEGLYAEPACDLAAQMRGWNTELLAGNTTSLLRSRCNTLAQLTGVDTEAIWQWGYIERVATGLHLIEAGYKDRGMQYLAVAERLV